MGAKKPGMATGVQVARITVKVSPDTKMFRKELKKQLDGLEKSLASKAKVSVDTKAATAEAKKAAEAMSKNKVKFNIDSKSLDTDVEKMRKKMDLLDLKWDKKKKDFLRGGTFEKVSAPKFEFAQMRSESNRIIQEFERARDKALAGNKDLALALKPDLKWWNPKVLRNRLGLGDGLTIPVKYEEKNKPGNKTPTKGSGGKGADLVPNFGTGINPAGYAVVLAGVAEVAAPLMGLITTSLLAIPGMISMIAAPIAAITLGLDGFKKAAESIKEPFEGLQQTMSKTAEDSFTPVMQRIADEIFPKLEASLPGVTKGLADMADSALDGLAGPRMEQSIERIGQAFSDIDLSGFTSGISGLIDEFTKELPDITKWLNDSGKGFNEWVTKISQDGTLETAFDQLGHTIDTVLSKLADWGRAAVNFMGTPGSMNGFIETLGKIGDGITKIIELSGKLNEAWQAVVQAGRFVGYLGNLIEGDLKGAWSNAEDLFTNKPWLENATSAGTKAQVDALTKSAQEAGNAASDAQGKLQSLVGEGAPQSLKGAVLPGGHGAGGGASVAAPEPKTQIEPPDTTAAMAAINQYKDDVTTVISGIKTALDDVGQIKAPDLSGFAASFDGMEDVARGAMQSVVASIEQGGNNAAAAATAAGNSIYQAMLAVVPLFQTVGLQMMAGLAAGIQAGSSGAITAAVNAATSAYKAAKDALQVKSPSRKFMEIGGYASEGLAVGIENGIGPVIDQAKGLAAKVADAFASGADPSLNLDGYTNKEVSRMEKVLNFESKRLGMQAKALDYQAKTTGNDALKGKADEIRLQQDQINMQREMLGLTQEYADLQNPGGGSKSDNPFLASIQELMKVPDAFGGATMSQAMQDLGIGGNGALEAMGGYGAELLTKGVTNIFNTSNVDDTISLHNNQLNRQSQGIVGR